MPYKEALTLAPEYLLKFNKGDSINKETFENRTKDIKRAFEGDNKGMNQRADEMLNNTIKFLRALVTQE